MSAPAPRWHVFPDAAALEQTVRAEIAERAAGAIEARGAFSLVLAGGSTPRRLYASLTELPSPSWAHWHVYFTDERCLPRGDPQRNDTTARGAWLDHVGIPASQVHAIPAELGAEAGARAYAGLLTGVGPFDLVLLGLGADGHVASLFPGQRFGLERDAPAAIPVHAAPKPPPERVSLSASRLGCSLAAFVLVTGEAKRPAIAALRARDDGVLYRISPTNGIDVYADADAAS